MALYLINIKLRMSVLISGAFASFFGLETVLISTLLSFVGLISSGERLSEALRVERLSYAEDGRKNGRNYFKNAFRSGSSEFIDMCRLFAAKRLTEAIIIRKEGKILTLARACGRDLAARASC
jgi:hypothetical protein